MELSQCPRCGTYVLAGRTNGYPVAVNMTGLDAQSLARALVDGRQVYRPRLGERGNVVGLEWVKPGSQPLDGSMVAEHECGSTLVYRPVAAQGAANPHPPRVRPSSGHGGAEKGHPWTGAPERLAESATPRLSKRTHPCELCNSPIEIDGAEEYVAVELGATVVWAQHNGGCTAS